MLDPILSGIDWTPIIINVAGVVITAVVGIVGNTVRKWLGSKLNSQQLDFLGKIALVAVQAAEQIYGAAAGDEKRDYALGVIDAELKRRHIKLDISTIYAAVEAAVVQEFNYPNLVANSAEEADNNAERSTVVVAEPAKVPTEG